MGTDRTETDLTGTDRTGTDRTGNDRSHAGTIPFIHNLGPPAKPLRFACVFLMLVL